MREIKFRAWDGETMFPANDVFINQDGEVYVEDNDSRYGGLLYKKDWIIMMYTGLKDKNGREIYEGDIVKNGNALPFAILWDNMICHNEMYDMYKNNNYKIIGNIYENPELLEAK